MGRQRRSIARPARIRPPEHAPVLQVIGLDAVEGGGQPGGGQALGLGGKCVRDVCDVCVCVSVWCVCVCVVVCVCVCVCVKIRIRGCG